MWKNILQPASNFPKCLFFNGEKRMIPPRPKEALCTHRPLLWSVTGPERKCSVEGTNSCSSFDIFRKEEEEKKKRSGSNFSQSRTKKNCYGARVKNFAYYTIFFFSFSSEGRTQLVGGGEPAWRREDFFRARGVRKGIFLHLMQYVGTWAFWHCVPIMIFGRIERYSQIYIHMLSVCSYFLPFACVCIIIKLH